MEQHLRSCPTAVRLSRAAAQPYFRAGCNAGSASEAVPRPGRPPPASIGGPSQSAGSPHSDGGTGGKTSVSPTDNSHHRQARPPDGTPTNSSAGQKAEPDPEALQSTSHSAAASAGMPPGAEGGSRDGAGGVVGEGDCGIGSGRRLALGAELAWQLAPSALAQLLVRIQQAHAQVWSGLRRWPTLRQGALWECLPLCTGLAAWKLLTPRQLSVPCCQRALCGMQCLRSPSRRPHWRVHVVLQCERTATHVAAARALSPQHA